MIAILVFLIIVLTTLAVFEEHLGKYRVYAFLAIGTVFVLVTGFREIGIDRDSENYEYFFNNYDDPLLLLNVEFSYLLLSRVFYVLTQDVHALFLFYAFLGVFTKWYAIQKLSATWFLPAMIYLGHYFIVHDFTQIRAGVASGLLLISVFQIIRQNKKLAFALMLCALFFHYSSLIMFPLLFLDNRKMGQKEMLCLIGIIPFCYVLYFMHFNILTSIPIPYISEKIEAYSALTERGLKGFDEINVFNLVFLVKIVIFIYVCYFYHTIRHFNENISILLRIQALSIYSFVIFAFLPVLSFRISELYGIVDIIVYSTVFYTIKQSYVARLITAMIGVVMLLINVFYVELLNV
jgi:hypothetical protein